MGLKRSFKDKFLKLLLKSILTTRSDSCNGQVKDVWLTWTAPGSVHLTYNNEMVDFRKTAEELGKFSSSKVLGFEAKLFFRITFELR